jgi:hypothetical protein
VRNWVADATAKIKIKSDFHDQEDDNFASGLSNVICKDGQTTVTADIPFNGKKLTNVAAPTNPTDAATKAYADAIRSFSTAINLTGATPQATIGFSVADIGFGARVAGTPAGTLNRFVWNDKPDLSGTDVAVMDDTGALTTKGALGIGGSLAIYDASAKQRTLVSDDQANNEVFLIAKDATETAVAQMRLRPTVGLWVDLPAAAAGVVFTTGNSPRSTSYVKLANGFILQWGLVTADANGNAFLTFPTAFPTGLGSINANVDTSAGIAATVTYVTTVSGLSSSGATIQGRVVSAGSVNIQPNGQFRWMAVGY